MQPLKNIWLLGVKELRSVFHDHVLILFVIYAFSLAIYSGANGISGDVNNASLGIVDEDQSILSAQIVNALLPPLFDEPVQISASEIDQTMDDASYGFVLVIPSGFEADILAGRQPEIQLNIDATLVIQARIGAGYIQNIISSELTRFMSGSDAEQSLPLTLKTRFAFNPNASSVWFTGMTLLVEMITVLSMALTGAALIREREHGTIEHLLVLPVTPFEIAVAKVWANGLVIWLATLLSLIGVIHYSLNIPIAGSTMLFMAGVALYLFFGCALGVFLGTIANTMPQFALMTILVLLPMNLLSGSITPIESQPHWLQVATLALPTRHFVEFSQAILFRGAGLDIVWPNFLAVFLIGFAFLTYSILRFRSAITA